MNELFSNMAALVGILLVILLIIVMLVAVILIASGLFIKNRE